MEKTNSQSSSLQNVKTNIKVKINDQYIIQSLYNVNSLFKIYKGVDTVTYSYVIIYVRLYAPQNSNFSSNLKQLLKQKLCPQVKWKGLQKINKYTYEVEVHEKFGPSIQEIMNIYKHKVSDSTFYLLSYQLIKLVEKIANFGYVYRNLNTFNIVLHPQPQKNQIFVLNLFDIKKNNQQCPPINTKYCSIAAHLGLKASYKDDLESIIYILLDIYTCGRFMNEQKIKDYFLSQLTKIPKTLVDFYFYVRNLSHNQQINFMNWKNIFKGKFPKNFLNKPYQWIVNKSKINNFNSQDQLDQEEQQNDKPREPEQNDQKQILFDDQKEQFQMQDQKISHKIQKTTLTHWNDKIRQTN